MSQKILLAVDGSERGFEAVSIVGNLVKDHPDLHLILFHCVPHVSGLLPGELCAGLEPSSVLTPPDQVRLGKAIFEESRRRLLAVGFPENKIEFKLKAGSIDPAQDIQLQAESEEAGTIAVGRRGLNQLQTLLLGSVSNKVAQYAQHQPVWIVDTPVYESPRVLVAMEGAYDAPALTRYLAEFVAPIPQLEYTFMHLMSPVPPTLWDDGQIGRAHV
jgi:nucleotide-binding universal stress UspA family protein